MTTPYDSLSGFDVSRETSADLEEYVRLLLHWNKTINLISKATEAEVWKRHIFDCAQIKPVIEPHPGKRVDIGSGAGLPGLVLAILEKGTDTNQICIEADLRKSEFIRTVIRKLDLSAKVITRRSEDTPRQEAGVVTARALSSLDKLLEHAERHLMSGGVAIFHKGEQWESEVAQAKSNWTFKINMHPSIVAEHSVILEISEIQRAEPR